MYRCTHSTVFRTYTSSACRLWPSTATPAWPTCTAGPSPTCPDSPPSIFHATPSSPSSPPCRHAFRQVKFSVYVTRSTGWDIRLFPRFSWHQNKSWVVLYAPNTKTQLLLWCQQNLENNVMCHPVGGWVKKRDNVEVRAKQMNFRRGTCFGTQTHTCTNIWCEWIYQNFYSHDGAGAVSGYYVRYW